MIDFEENYTYMICLGKDNDKLTDYIWMVKLYISKLSEGTRVNELKITQYLSFPSSGNDHLMVHVTTSS